MRQAKLDTGEIEREVSQSGIINYVVRMGTNWRNYSKMIADFPRQPRVGRMPGSEAEQLLPADPGGGGQAGHGPDIQGIGTLGRGLVWYKACGMVCIMLLSYT